MISHFAFDTSVLYSSNANTHSINTAIGACNNSLEGAARLPETGILAMDRLGASEDVSEGDSSQVSQEKNNLFNQVYTGVNLLKVNNQLLLLNSTGISPAYIPANTYLHTNTFTPHSYSSVSPPHTSSADDAGAYQSDSNIDNGQPNFYLLQGHFHSKEPVAFQLPESELMLALLSDNSSFSGAECSTNNPGMTNDLAPTSSAISSPPVFNIAPQAQKAGAPNVNVGVPGTTKTLSPEKSNSIGLSYRPAVSHEAANICADNEEDANRANIKTSDNFAGEMVKAFNSKASNTGSAMYNSSPCRLDFGSSAEFDTSTSKTVQKSNYAEICSKNLNKVHEANTANASKEQSSIEKTFEANTRALKIDNCFSFPAAVGSPQSKKRNPLKIAVDHSKTRPKHNKDGSLRTLMGKASLLSPISATANKKARLSLNLNFQATTKDFKSNDNLKTPVFQTSVLDFSKERSYTEINKKSHYKVQKSITGNSIHKSLPSHKKSHSLSTQSLTNLSNQELDLKLSNISAASQRSLTSINEFGLVTPITTGNTPLSTSIGPSFSQRDSIKSLNTGAFYNSYANTFSSMHSNVKANPASNAKRFGEQSNNESFVSSLLTNGDESSSESESARDALEIIGKSENGHLSSTQIGSSVNNAQQENAIIESKENSDFMSKNSSASNTGNFIKFEMLPSNDNEDRKSGAFESNDFRAEHFVVANLGPKSENLDYQTTISPTKLVSTVSGAFNNLLKSKAETIDFKLDDTLKGMLPFIASKDLSELYNNELFMASSNDNKALEETKSKFDNFDFKLNFELLGDIHDTEKLYYSGEELISDEENDVPNFKALFLSLGQKAARNRKSKSVDYKSHGYDGETKPSLKKRLSRRKTCSVEDLGQHTKMCKSSVSASSLKKKLKSSTTILNKSNKQSLYQQANETHLFVSLSRKQVHNGSHVADMVRNRSVSMNSSFDSLSLANEASSVLSASTDDTSIYSHQTSPGQHKESGLRMNELSSLHSNTNSGKMHNHIVGSAGLLTAPVKQYNDKVHKKSVSLPVNSLLPAYANRDIFISMTVLPTDVADLEHRSLDPNGIAKQPARRGRKPSLQYDPSKIFNCTLCPRKFKRQEHLKRHFRSLHTGEKPFGCHICGKSFSRSDNLGQHLKTHNNC